MAQVRSSTAVRSTARTAPGTLPLTPRRTPLELVPRAQPRRRVMTRAYTALAAVGSGVGLFLVVFLHVLLAQGQAQLDDLDTRAERERAQNSRLRVAVAELESPTRIAGAARERLGMVPPASVTFLQVSDPASPLPPVPTGPVVKPSPPTTGAKTAPTTAPARTTPTTVAGKTTPTTVRRVTTPTPTTAAGTRAQAGGTTGGGR